MGGEHTRAVGWRERDIHDWIDGRDSARTVVNGSHPIQFDERKPQPNNSALGYTPTNNEANAAIT